MYFFLSVFLSRRSVFFWMIYFFRGLDMGGIEKVLGMEINYYKKSYCGWIEGMSFCKRIFFFEIDG